jgi:peptide/nickel transport system substrate-binding protein
MPEGTGPYALERWERGREVLLRAQGAATALRQLRFLVVPKTPRQIEMLTAGEAHVVADLTPREARRLRGVKGVRVASRKGLLVQFLAMDCARERSPYVAAERNPFRDPRVRRAVALGLDRQALVEGPQEGEAEVVDQIVGPQVFGYDPELPPWVPDREGARGLLAAAGFEAGFDVDLDFNGDPDGATERMVELAATQLRAIGIRVRPRRQSLASLVKRVEARDTSFYLMPWIGTSGDFSSSAEYLLRTPGNGHGIDNGGMYSSKEVDGLLDRAQATVVAAQRQRLLRQAARKVHDDAPVVPLCRLSDLYAVSAGLAFEPRLDREIRGAELRWR